MSRRTVWKCDSCGTEVMEYDPRGWMRVQFDRQMARGQLADTQRGDVCSPSCEVTWLKQRLLKLEQENESEHL
jgi:hypothetical protein